MLDDGVVTQPQKLADFFMEELEALRVAASQLASEEKKKRS